MRKLIRIAQENCSGCMRCAQACSFFTTPEREFNPSRSKIIVLPELEQGLYEVRLTDECDGCGICIHHCDFDVLSRPAAEVQHV